MMDMSQYIDRAKLMGVLTEGETQKKLRSGTGEEAYMAVLGIVNFAPAEDVAPVVRGEWLLKHIGAGHYWECSVCHTNPCIYVTEHTKFCPNCGAKMDGKDTNVLTTKEGEDNA